MKETTLSAILLLAVLQLSGQGATNKSVVEYTIGNSLVAKCLNCGAELGHVKYHEFEGSTDSYFQVSQGATIETPDGQACAICQADLFKDHNHVLTGTKWNVFKQDPESKYLIDQVKSEDWDTHLDKCIICQDNDHFAPGIHFGLKRKN